MATDKDYADAAGWAEAEMELSPNSATAKRGKQAAGVGRAALETAFGGAAALDRALGGRPALNPDAGPGEHARIRHVRLAPDLDAQLDAAAQAQHRNASEIMREALTRYLAG